MLTINSESLRREIVSKTFVYHFVNIRLKICCLLADHICFIISLNYDVMQMDKMGVEKEDILLFFSPYEPYLRSVSIRKKEFKLDLIET